MNEIIDHFKKEFKDLFKHAAFVVAFASVMLIAVLAAFVGIRIAPEVFQWLF